MNPCFKTDRNKKFDLYSIWKYTLGLQMFKTLQKQRLPEATALNRLTSNPMTC